MAAISGSQGGAPRVSVPVTGSVIPVYPVLLVLAILVGKLVESWAPLPGLVRPLVLLIVVTLAVQLVASLIGGRGRGGYAAALIVMAAFDLTVAGLLFAAALIALGWTSILNRRVSTIHWPRLTSFLNLIGAGALALTVTGAVVLGLGWPVHRSAGPVDSATSGGETPDIYLILLDAYPRSDSLAVEFGIDNSPFLDSLRGLGFAVANEARANYNSTPLTIASMLNAQHIETLMPNPPSGLRAQVQRLGKAINDGDALLEARRLGYTVVALPSPAEYVSLYGADQVVDTGHLTLFEYTLFRGAGVIPYLLPDVQGKWFRAQHRERIVATFSHLKALAAESAREPRLVFAHVLAPHPPFVFNADGSPSERTECFWELCTFELPLRADVRDAVRGQISYLNDLVTDTVETIVRQSRPSVLVIFSDHGMRHDPEDPDEMLRSLFVSYTPGRPGMFPSDATPINILPKILNEYGKAGMTLASEESYWLPAEGASNGFFPLTLWREELSP